MYKTVMDWLEETAARCPDRTAYRDRETSLSFRDVSALSRRIASGLSHASLSREPVAVLLPRSTAAIPAFLGIAESGRAYAPIGTALPEARIERILSQLRPCAVLTDEEHLDAVRGYVAAAFGEADAPQILLLSSLAQETEDPEALAKIRSRMNEEDPLYIIFTSGSSGHPKGVASSHHALMCYIEAYARMMAITEDDVLGTQAPLDYIAAIRDIYLPLRTGCSSFLLARELFMQPAELFTEMTQESITAAGWSTSALTVLARLGALQLEPPKTLKKVCFSGSVMPGAILADWQKALPETVFVNQYGPTEATASCTFYRVDHTVTADETLPIGVPYDNYDVFLLREDGSPVPSGEMGEICVAGPILALGYWNDRELTERSFVPDPRCAAYPRRIYRTGDIGRFREDGLLEFHGRRDRQIKHMGHRVELDEIEAAAAAIDGVRDNAVLYDPQKEVLHLFYSGTAARRDVALALRAVLPDFMIPRKVHPMEELPYLPSGKTDRRALEAQL